MLHVHGAAFLAWLLGWVLLLRVPRLPRRAAGGDDDATLPLWIVVPARDEATTLPALLDDLDRHRPPGTRVIVVDDHSEDGTADVARRYPFVEVMTASPVDDGGAGKARACAAGAARAPEGSTLAFLDADVRIHGDALERAASLARERGGLVTVWPRHHVERAYEHASALFNVLALVGVGCGSLLPPRRVLGGFGPFMVTTTDVYRRVGGHDAVGDTVVEDFALARRYGRAGLPVSNFGGHDDVGFRMYPDGLRSLVDGWTKNFALGAIGSLPRAVLVGVWLTYSIGVFTWAGGVPHPLSLALIALFVLQFGLLFRQVGAFGWADAVLYPLHVLFFLAVFLRSLAHTFLLRRVRWRGRKIPARGAPAVEPATDAEGSDR